MVSTKHLYRSRTNRMLGGVAGGIADYLGVNPTIVRLGLVAALIIGHVATLILYVAVWLFVPEQPFMG